MRKWPAFWVERYKLWNADRGSDHGNYEWNLTLCLGERKVEEEKESLRKLWESSPISQHLSQAMSFVSFNWSKSSLRTLCWFLFSLLLGISIILYLFVGVSHTPPLNVSKPLKSSLLHLYLYSFFLWSPHFLSYPNLCVHSWIKPSSSPYLCDIIFDVESV